MTNSQQTDAGLPPPSRREARSPSPGVKRRASEVTEPEEHDVTMDAAAPVTETPSDPISEDSTATTAPGNYNNSPGNNSEPKSDNVYPTPSSMETYTTSTTTRNESQAESINEISDRPSIDDQVAQVNVATAQPLQEGQKGFVVSMTWLKQVLSRTTTEAGKADEADVFGELGPVTNTDLVVDTEPSDVLKDEAGEPFTPLRPGLQVGVDYEIVPQQGWDLLMKWYGLADKSPIIVRYAHESASEDSESLEYELNPPIFTIAKLANPAAPPTPQTLKEKSSPPKRVLQSRQTIFQRFLKLAKDAVGIEIDTKVRVWVLLKGSDDVSGTGPATSTSPNAGSSVVFDLNAFLSLDADEERRLLDFKDQTMNSQYNGRSLTLFLAGLGSEAAYAVVLEEFITGPGRASGQWISDASEQDLARFGAASGNMKNGPHVKPRKTAPVPVASPTAAQQPSSVTRNCNRRLGVAGLDNPGCSCFMNSALQCMQSVPELTCYFLSESSRLNIRASPVADDPSRWPLAARAESQKYSFT